MAYEHERIINEDGLPEIFSWNEETPEDRHLTYRIDAPNSMVFYFPRQEENTYLNRITLKGFAGLPDEFSPTGFIKGGLFYYIDKKCRKVGINDMIIERGGNKLCRGFAGGVRRMILPYKDLRSLKDRLTAFNTEAKRMRSSYADEFFHHLFPNKFEVEQSTTHVRRRRIIENLNPDLIRDFTSDEIQALEQFYVQLVEGRYISIPHKLRLIKKTKIKFDLIALDAVINRFEEFLQDDTKTESDWGGFLKENLFVIDSKYIKAIPEVILTTVRARQVDFGLMDYDNYLDIFEIKKPTTELLAASTDRNNHFWHAKTVKAITQAEKYLHYATIRSEQIQNDLRLQPGFENVVVNKPRVTLITGSSNQLDTDQKKNDFRMLRSSLKNVQIVLYDELLKRIQLQKEKIVQ